MPTSIKHQVAFYASSTAYNNKLIRLKVDSIAQAFKAIEYFRKRGNSIITAYFNTYCNREKVSSVRML